MWLYVTTLKFLIISSKALTLKEEVEALEFYKNQKSNIRKYGEHWKIGKTQIADIIKTKKKLMKNWYKNDNVLEY